MKISSIAVMAGILMNTASVFAWAANPAEIKEAGFTMIDIAGHEVPVAAGGLYDRFRSNPPLSAIESEAPGVDLSWFRGLKKTKVDIGFESYSPNFYYKNNRITAVFTADLERLRALIPAEVLDKVQPLQVWPGRGLVALTAYAYEYCDNDSYNEIALSIVTNEPGSSNLGPISLVGQSMSKDFWGYVLKLPVNTELARVRGVVGYNLPKWLTGIDRRDNDTSVIFEIVDHETGKVDVVFEGRKLGDTSDEVELVTNGFTNVGHDGALTYGYAVSRQLSHATSMSADSVNLTLNEGSLATFMKSLKLGRMVKYEYVPQFQSALYAPEPLKSILATE
ncbi:acetoacetate decarboxylase (ADC) [Metapseudomonas lalkuanensis]|uniref:acetoacetate decarboxylase (ADC) n=1 Tax=Metapseudomonas lalkuanensis TaxID=2604832 RepID=UPI001CF3AE7E|nr:acetoacetate decarboxylase (ADC) [Pseudomonas lalkuanensis]UCP00600.1 acetoacetate decarboxylase (ADC) [Pseudomonas lalkuanensis]